MLKVLSESLTNSSDLVGYYSTIRTAFGPYPTYLNRYIEFEVDQVHSGTTMSSRSVDYFLRAIDAEDAYDGVVQRAIGVFDGQLYLWLFIPELNTELTRSLFTLKAAIEQEVGGGFEIHVEPLGDRSVVELMPSGYSLI